MGEAGLVAGLLGGHAEVDHVHEDLGVTLGLEVPAHDPEGQHRAALPGDEGRDDGVEGALAGLETVPMPGIQGEGLPPVLDGEAHTVRADPGPEPPVHALDERDHVALGVGRGQVDGVGVEGRVPRGDPGRGPAGVDELVGTSLRATTISRALIVCRHSLHRTAPTQRSVDLTERTE